jgi:Uma2 family endonuclease
MTLKDRFIMTDDEFDVFVKREENAARSFEYIGGEVFEKMVSNDAATYVVSQIQGFLFVYLLSHKRGRVLADNTGYVVMGERYIPDVSYISYEKHPDILGVAYRPDPPDLAVEVVSSARNSEQVMLHVKVQNYLLAGTVVWVAHPGKRQVDVFEPGKKPLTLREGDTLTGGDLLPGFKLAIRTIFEGLPENDET